MGLLKSLDRVISRFIQFLIGLPSSLGVHHEALTIVDTCWHRDRWIATIILSGDHL